MDQQDEDIFTYQKKFTENILRKYRMEWCKTISIPLMPNEKLKKEDGSKLVDAQSHRNLIESFLYLIATRLDIMYAFNLLSRYI